jgi:hypothetical protein
MPVAALAGLMKAPLSLLSIAAPGNDQKINDEVSDVLGYPVQGPVAGMADLWSTFYTGVALDAAGLALPEDILSSVASSADNALETGQPEATALTYRGDPTPPDVAFNEGLSAKGSSEDLLAHANDSSNPPSAFISTSKSYDVAVGFNSTNVYVVRPTGGIDVNAALGELSPFQNELEIAVPWQIHPGDIRAVTLPQEGVSILNPNWRP